MLFRVRTHNECQCSAPPFAVGYPRLRGITHPSFITNSDKTPKICHLSLYSSEMYDSFLSVLMIPYFGDLSNLLIDVRYYCIFLKKR